MHFEQIVFGFGKFFWRVLKTFSMPKVPFFCPKSNSDNSESCFFSSILEFGRKIFDLIIWPRIHYAMFFWLHSTYRVEQFERNLIFQQFFYFFVVLGLRGEIFWLQRNVCRVVETESKNIFYIKNLPLSLIVLGLRPAKFGFVSKFFWHGCRHYLLRVQGNLLMKNDFSEILEFFSSVSDLAKCFLGFWASFLFYWGQFFSRVVKTDLYLSSETFCGKNCFVVFMLFWIILGGRVR